MKRNLFVMLFFAVFYFVNTLPSFADKEITQVITAQNYGGAVGVARTLQYVICQNCELSRAKFIAPPEPVVAINFNHTQTQNTNTALNHVVPKKITVYFSLNSYNLSQNDKNQLNTFFSTGDFTNYNINVFGYTDWYGAKYYNDWLAQKRADTVADFIKLHYGITPLNVKGFGKEHYESTTIPALNRRVNVFFQTKNSN